MGDIFIRRTTGFLIFVITALCIGVVALLVLLFTTPHQQQPVVETINAAGKPEKIVEAVTVGTWPWELEYRIPTTTLPLHYDLYLHPNLETGLFTGKVAIHISVLAEMSYLVAHFKEMNITSTKLVSMEGAGGTEVQLKEYFEYKPNQFWVLKPMDALKPGKYSMELEFNGSLEGRITGFYKSVYTNAKGEER